MPFLRVRFDMGFLLWGWRNCGTSGSSNRAVWRLSERKQISPPLAASVLQLTAAPIRQQWVAEESQLERTACQWEVTYMMFPLCTYQFSVCPCCNARFIRACKCRAQWGTVKRIGGCGLCARRGTALQTTLQPERREANKSLDDKHVVDDNSQTISLPCMFHSGYASLELSKCADSWCEGAEVMTAFGEL